MRWTTIVVVAALAAGACGAAPALRVADDVPADLRDLAEELWPTFVEAFPAQKDCIGEVGLSLAWDLPDRARYLPEERAVVVRVPGTAPNLTASIVHELGHHLEFACPSQVGVRGAFLQAEGLATDAPWYGTGDWFATPSEHWAEAVVEYVLGERSVHRGRVAVTPKAVAVVEGWARQR